MDSGARGEQSERDPAGAETIRGTAVLVRPKPAATLQSQRIYDQLRRDIAGQRLQPGTVLNEIALAENMAASRTPLREALTRLRQQGFLERKGRQLAVKAFSLTDVRNLYQLREALERMAVVLCVERASDADLLEIGEQLERYSDFDIGQDYAAFNEYANQFHRSLADICGNPMIRNQLYAIHDKVLVVNARFWRKPRSAQEAYEGHQFLLRAIQKRDAILAEAAMRAHIREVVDLYLEVGSCPTSPAG